MNKNDVIEVDDLIAELDAIQEMDKQNAQRHTKEDFEARRKKNMESRRKWYASLMPQKKT